MKIAVAAIVCIAAVACFAEDEFPVPTLENLRKWYTGYYEDARYVILQKEGIVEELEELHRNTDDWHIKVICEAFLYRKRNLEKAVLIDRKWGCEFKGPGPGLLSEYAIVLVNHFGREAAPLVAEKILHTWPMETALSQTSALRTLRLMRYRFLPEIALKAVSERTIKPGAYATAMRIVMDCLQGLPALRFRVDRDFLRGDLVASLSTYVLPEELRRFRAEGEISVPSLSIQGERREKIVEGVCELLENGDPEVQMWAIVALQYEPTPAAVARLSEMLLPEGKRGHWTCIYQWCAYILKVMDTEEARTALALNQARSLARQAA